MLKLDLEKAKEPEINFQPHRNSKRVPENHILLLISYAKTFDYVDYNKLENSLRDGNTLPPYLPPEKSVCKLGSIS